jgi:hypothetical protein
MRVKKELVVCVLAGFVSFCFAAAIASLVLDYSEPGCIATAIGAVQSKISRFVSAREHGLCLEGSPLSQPMRDDPVLKHEQVFLRFTGLQFAQILLTILSSELCIIEKQILFARPSSPAFCALGTELCLAGSA